MNTYDVIVKEVEDQIEALSLNCKTTYHSEYPMTELTSAKTFQIRDASHEAPAANVKQYAEQMKHKPFPPVVITRDGFIIDGNTRIAARMRNKNDFATVIEIDIDYKNALVREKRLLEAFAGIANQAGGQRLTTAEAIRLAKNIKIDLDWSNHKLAEHLGISSTAISSAVAEVNAETKMDKVGVSHADMNASQRQCLGREKAIALNDDPYRQLVVLVKDAGLPMGEVTKLVKVLSVMGSDTEALAAIAVKREEKKHEITQRKLTGNTNPQPSILILRHLGAIAKYAGVEGTVVETSPALSASFVERVTTARDILSAILVAQENANVGS